MIIIENIYTGEQVKFYKADKEFAGEKFFCTDLITNVPLRRINGTYEYAEILRQIGNKAEFMITLKDCWKVIL